MVIGEEGAKKAMETLFGQLHKRIPSKTGKNTKKGLNRKKSGKNKQILVSHTNKSLNCKLNENEFK